MAYKSKAPYNFIGLDKRILDRYEGKDDNNLIFHNKYYKEYNSGRINYEIEVLTPLHISDGKESFIKNPNGQYVIPGNTLRGLTRYNASILSFASTINKSIEKYDIQDKTFYYRDFASKDSTARKYYSDILGQKQYVKNGYRYTVLENVNAGYIRKDGKRYIITPSVKLKHSLDDKTSKNRSYTSVHEKELRRKNIKGISYLYKEDIKNFGKKDLKHRLNKYINRNYRPYYTEINYDYNGNNTNVNPNGKYKGMLANSNYMNKKIHHYLIFQEDKTAEKVIITEEQAELYKDDLNYTNKLIQNNQEIKSDLKYYALPEEGEVKPVFFIKRKDKVLFGFTPYLRIPAEGSIYDGIPDTHKNYNKIDWVDSIFGWKEYRTKVSFLDAIIYNKDNINMEKNKMVLSEPKASWYRGYLKQRKSSSLESYNTESFEIRGRKFYWLNSGPDYKAMEEGITSAKVSSILNCLDKGTKFKGYVKFENLSNEELGLLLYSLKQGDTDGRFNMGKGKPYGLGKCKIRLTSLEIFDINKKYTAFNNDFVNKVDIDSYINKFKKYIEKSMNVDDINKLKSYKEYNLSKKQLSHEESRYMSINKKEFAHRAELPTIEQVVREKGDVVSSKMNQTSNKRNTNENNYDRRQRNRNNRQRSYSSNNTGEQFNNQMAEQLKKLKDRNNN